MTVWLAPVSEKALRTLGTHAPLLSPKRRHVVLFPRPLYIPRVAVALVDVSSKPESRRGLFSTAAFDISSADDFPSLPLEDVPGRKRTVRVSAACVARRALH